MQTLKRFLAATLILGLTGNPYFTCFAEFNASEYFAQSNPSESMSEGGMSFSEARESILDQYEGRLADFMESRTSILEEYASSRPTLTDIAESRASILDQYTPEVRTITDYTSVFDLTGNTPTVSPSSIIPNYSFTNIDTFSDIDISFTHTSITIPNASTFTTSSMLTSSVLNFDTTPTSSGIQAINNIDVQQIQNVITLNNNKPVSVTAANQNMNLNNDQVINSVDVALMNNIVNFTSLTVTQQAATIAGLSPQLAAVVVNTILGQASTTAENTQAIDAVSTILEAMPSDKSSEIVNQLMKTPSGQETAYRLVNEMAPDKGAALLNQMATAPGTLSGPSSLQNAVKILENMNEAKAAEAIASNKFTPEGIANVICSMSSIDRAAKLVQKTETSKATAILKAVAKIEGGAKVAASILTEMASTDQYLDKAATIVNGMDSVYAAKILAEMDSTASVKIIGSNKLSVENAVKIFDEMSKTQAGNAAVANLIWKLYEQTATSAKAKSIFAGMAETTKTSIKQALGDEKTTKIIGAAAAPAQTSNKPAAGTTIAGKTYTLAQISGKTIIPGTIIDDGTNKYIAISQFTVTASGEIPSTVRFNKVDGLEGEHFVYNSGNFTQVYFVTGSTYSAGGKTYTAVSAFAVENGIASKDALLKDANGNVYKVEDKGVIGSPVTVYTTTGQAGAKVAAGSVMQIGGKYYISTQDITYNSEGNISQWVTLKNGPTNYRMDSLGTIRVTSMNDQTEFSKDWREQAMLKKCRAADETFSDGSITIFWTNEEAIPVQDLNLYVPGWDLRMLITADFNNDGKQETQTWDMHPAMAGTLGKTIKLDMPAELNGQTVTVAFYVVDSQGRPLVAKTDAATGETTWAIGKAGDPAYVFGAGTPNLPESAITFKVNRDPANGEQLPQVKGYKLSGGDLTLQFATPFHPSDFTAFYVIVNGEYTQISDFKHFVSDNLSTMTIDLDAFGINIPSGAKVQIVAKEWTAGMTLIQTVIPGATKPATTQTSVKAGDTVKVGDLTLTAKTAFTYTTDGKIPANVQFNDAQGRLYTNTASGIQQNSFLAGDTVKIDNTSYKVTTPFTYTTAGKIPQGTKLTGADNKVYIADSTGALKLETAVAPESVKAGDTVKVGDLTLTAKTAFTYTTDGKIPANVQFNDAQGRLYTNTASGIQQNSFLAGDTVKIDNTSYKVTTPFTYTTAGKIPQGTKLTGADNKVYVADAAGVLKSYSLKAEQKYIPNKLVQAGDTVHIGNQAFTAKTDFNFTSDGKIPVNVQFNDAQGRLYTNTASGIQQNSFLAGDTVKIDNTSYKVTTPFAFTTAGKIPQGTKLTGADNKVYVADAAGVLKLESSIVPESVKAGDTVKVGDLTLTAKTAFTYTTDGKIPANVQFNDAQGRLYTNTASGIQQNSFLVGDKITLDKVEYTVKTAFTFKADGTIPQDTKFADVSNKIYVADAAGVLKPTVGLGLEKTYRTVKAGETVKLGDSSYTVKTEFTYTEKGIPANVQLIDPEGRLFTTTVTGDLQQNSFLVGDKITLDKVEYTVKTAFMFNVDGTIPVNTVLVDKNNNEWYASGTGKLNKDAMYGPGLPHTVTLNDGTVLTPKLNYSHNADGSIPENIEFTDEKGHTYISTSDGKFQQTGYIAGDVIKLQDGTKLTATQNYTVIGDQMPANIKFTDPQGRSFVTTDDGAFKQTSYKAGDIIPLEGGTKLTAKADFTLDNKGNIPQGTKFVDQTNKEWTATADGKFTQGPISGSGSRTVTLTDGTVLTAKTDFTYKPDGSIPGNIEFTDAEGHTFITTADSKFKQTGYIAGDIIELQDGTKLTATQNYTVIGDQMPANIKFTDPQGRSFVTTDDGAFKQTSYKAGDIIPLEGSTKLTAKADFTLDNKGNIPQGTKFVDQTNKEWTATADGKFTQGPISGSGSRTVTLTDGTVLTAKTDFTYKPDGSIPGNIEFTDAEGHTFITTADSKFKQTGYIAGDIIELQDGTKLTATQNYTVIGDQMPANIKFTDPQGRSFVTTDDGAFKQTSYKAGDIIPLEGGTKLTAKADFTLDNKGNIPQGTKFVDQDNKEWTATADGKFTQGSISGSERLTDGKFTQNSSSTTPIVRSTNIESVSKPQTTDPKLIPAGTENATADPSLTTALTDKQKTSVNAVFGETFVKTLLPFQQNALFQAITAVGGEDNAKKIVTALNDVFTLDKINKLIMSDVKVAADTIATVNDLGIDTFKQISAELTKDKDIGTAMNSVKENNIGAFTQIVKVADDMGGVAKFKKAYQDLAAEDKDYVNNLLTANPAQFVTLVAYTQDVANVVGAATVNALTLGQQLDLAQAMQSVGGKDKFKAIFDGLTQDNSLGSTVVTAMIKKDASSFATLTVIVNALGGVDKFNTLYAELKKDTGFGAEVLGKMLSDSPEKFVNTVIVADVFGVATAKNIKEGEDSQYIQAIIDAGGMSNAKVVLSATKDVYTAAKVAAFDIATLSSVMKIVASTGADNFKATAQSLIKDPAFTTQLASLLSDKPADFAAVIQNAQIIGSNFKKIYTAIISNPKCGAEFTEMAKKDLLLFTTLMKSAKTLGMDQFNAGLTELASVMTERTLKNAIIYNPAIIANAMSAIAQVGVERFKTAWKESQASGQTQTFISDFTANPMPAGYTQAGQNTLVSVFGEDFVKSLTLDQRADLSQALEASCGLDNAAQMVSFLSETFGATAITSMIKSDIEDFGALVKTVYDMGFDKFTAGAKKLIEDKDINAKVAAIAKASPLSFALIVQTADELGFDAFKTAFQAITGDATIGSTMTALAKKDGTGFAAMVKTASAIGIDKFKDTLAGLTKDSTIGPVMKKALDKDPAGFAELIKVTAGIGGVDKLKTAYSALCADNVLGKALVDNVLAQDTKVFANLIKATHEKGIDAVKKSVDMIAAAYGQIYDEFTPQSIASLKTKDPVSYARLVAAVTQLGSVPVGIGCRYENETVQMMNNIAGFATIAETCVEVGGIGKFKETLDAIAVAFMHRGSTLIRSDNLTARPFECCELVKAVCSLGLDKLKTVVALFEDGDGHNQEKIALSKDIGKLTTLVNTIVDIGLDKATGIVRDSKGLIHSMVTKDVDTVTLIIKNFADIGMENVTAVNKELTDQFGDLAAYVYYNNPLAFCELAKTAVNVGIENFKTTITMLKKEFGEYGLAETMLYQNPVGLAELASGIQKMGIDKFKESAATLSELFGGLPVARALFANPAGTLEFANLMNEIGVAKTKEIIMITNYYLGKAVMAGEFVNNPSAFASLISGAAKLTIQEWEQKLKDFVAANPITETLPSYQDKTQSIVGNSSGNAGSGGSVSSDNSDPYQSHASGMEKYGLPAISGADELTDDHIKTLASVSGNQPIYFFNEDGKLVLRIDTITYYQDASGVTYTPHIGYSYSFTYNSAGECTGSIERGTDSNGNKISTLFDASGKPTTTLQYGADGSVDYIYMYEDDQVKIYDADGKLIETRPNKAVNSGSNNTPGSGYNGAGVFINRPGEADYSAMDGYGQEGFGVPRENGSNYDSFGNYVGPSQD